METMIQAHRGASAYCPENTLEAFTKAIEQGADCIELDVHLSKDGEIVVAHDDRLERVSNGTGYINDHTLEELKSLDFSKLHPGTVCRIPTLAEVFSLIKPKAIAVNIELKTTERLYPGLCKKLIGMAEEFGVGERILYSSFNHYSLREIKQLNPVAKIGLLYQLGMVDPWVYANYLGAYAIHPQFFIIATLPETVKRCHENGVKVNVWTVDESEAIKQMLKSGVDGIITNKPDVAIACRDAHSDGLSDGGC
ncbi:MAG: glycerophosphodiester phosphodiesterase [Treponema sp.]|jgi:glycerophosphoryl diester phosphodiesterase|nr:glycerophosphodiester phosphodiesterase [Treponema sp.]